MKSTFLGSVSSPNVNIHSVYFPSTALISSPLLCSSRHPEGLHVSFFVLLGPRTPCGCSWCGQGPCLPAGRPPWPGAPGTWARSWRQRTWWPGGPSSTPGACCWGERPCCWCPGWLWSPPCVSWSLCVPLTRSLLCIGCHKLYTRPCNNKFKNQYT